MKILRNLLVCSCILFLTQCTSKKEQEKKPNTSTTANRSFFQLKTYTFNTLEQQEKTDLYLKNAYLPALKKLNIAPVGVFKLLENNKDSLLQTYVLIPLKSLDILSELPNKLQKDSTYTSAGKEYLNALYNAPLYTRIESTLLRAFEEMPQLKTPELTGTRDKRIYELRSYESATENLYQNKVDMFNAGGEVRLFNKLDFNAVFYGEVVSGSKMPNLMYLTTFSDLESRDEHWKSFTNAPEWSKLKIMPKYQNNISNITITYLFPTDYSDY